MKRLHRILTISRRLAIAACAVLIGPMLRADVNGTSPNSTNTISSLTAGAALAEVGANTRVWTNAPNDPSVTNHFKPRRIVEMATGMNYFDGEQWQPSNPGFQIVADGFAAYQTQHKAHLAANLNQIGAVTVTTPDGTNLYSSPLGIGLYDYVSGNFAMIGTITNCSGTLVASNIVVFHNAFYGVCADIIYTMERGAFHQDVLLTGQLNPADYGYPSNTTRIQIITEFYNPPDPERIVRPVYVEQNEETRNQSASPDLIDEVLGFGKFTLGNGRSYVVPKTSPHDNGVPVAKRLFTVNQRKLLVESVPFVSIQKGVMALPVCGNSQTNQRGAMLNSLKGSAAYAAIPELKRTPAETASVPVPTAVEKLAISKRKGVIIDYEATIGGEMDDAVVFQGDTTYFLSGTYYCDGPTTIEGGAVFKYPLAVDGFGSGVYISLQINNALTLTTSRYRPAVFTAADDDTVGASIGTTIWDGYTGMPYYQYTNLGAGYGLPCLYLSGYSGTLSNLRFSFAEEAIFVDGTYSNNIAVNHSQFTHCIEGVEMGFGLGSGTPLVNNLNFNNCLLNDLQYCMIDDNGGDNYTFINCTFDGISQFMTTNFSPISLYSTNCVFANVTAYGTGYTHAGYNGFYNAGYFGDNDLYLRLATSSPFQSAGAGYHYLDPACGFIAFGTTGIDPDLLGNLRIRTILPPIVVSNAVLIENDVLYPTVPRDTNVNPALGYHYDAIDFAFDNLVVSNAALTLSNGVCVAVFGTNAFNLKAGSGQTSTLVSQGDPLNLNRVARYNCIQEQPVFWGSASNAAVNTVYITAGTGSNNFFFRFTDLSILSEPDARQQIVNSASFAMLPNLFVLQDCQIRGGSLQLDNLDDVSGTSLGSTNNLFERTAVGFVVYADGGHGGLPFNGYLRNNLFFGGSLEIDNSGQGTGWNAFDNMLYNTDTSSGVLDVTNSHNCYINVSPFSGTGGGDRTALSFAFQTGPLGNYYQSSGSVLINAGSCNSTNAGMYHFTTQTNQVKETNTVVDIGLHYVALNSFNQPDDSDGDGLPDYLEDTNGNGYYDSTVDLSNWAISNSSGGISGYILYLQGRNLNVTNLPWADTNGVVNLKVYTPLK